jgi:hypothetical protein
LKAARTRIRCRFTHAFTFSGQIYNFYNHIPFIFVAEEAKNTHAQKIMDRILSGATWINIHQLPVSTIQAIYLP